MMLRNGVHSMRSCAVHGRKKAWISSPRWKDEIFSLGSQNSAWTSSHHLKMYPKSTTSLCDRTSCASLEPELNFLGQQGWNSVCWLKAILDSYAVLAGSDAVLPWEYANTARCQQQVPQYQVFVNRKYCTQYREGPKLRMALMSKEKGWDSPKVESSQKWQHFNQGFPFCCLRLWSIFLEIITITGIMRRLTPDTFYWAFICPRLSLYKALLIKSF